MPHGQSSDEVPFILISVFPDHSSIGLHSSIKSYHAVPVFYLAVLSVPSYEPES